jgi:TRAP-type C4-dicarboxylate transport system permease small subunit
MNQIKIVAAILMMAGLLALVYGGFTYTKSTQQAKIGPLELTVQDKETVNVPVWAGVGAIVIGGLLLLSSGKKG